MEHRGQKSTIQAMEREAVSTTGRRKIPCLRERPSPLDWWEIRTAERQRCSMSPDSSEEIVTREFVIREKPKGIINIVDATNIERNLYLTMQLLELGVPMVVALNMMDELRENGGSVLVN